MANKKGNAIITGATGGMGKEMVADLSRDYAVYAVGRNAEELARLAAIDGVTTVQADLLDLLDSPGKPLSELGLPELDEVKVLVHSAAIAHRMSVEEATPADWRRHMDINVHVPAELTRRYLPALRAAEATVIFINSGAGRADLPDNAVYAATKHALYALAGSLRKAELGIRVSSVAPGPVDTPMLAGLQDYDPAEVIEPVEVARAVRAVIDAGPSTQLTEVQVRPRIELADRKRLKASR
ncbi:SDR family oxidoreductase [Corynebacterium endometrii]|uniref:Putative oxidoreductase n=1 Tax=Corynebacterium endometrii TaxID=2488819 RepID=A0A4P7QHC7_9CORY|nr:SDR family oxidoreductase [Corynebacterium endometrii]QCB29049.1 putative oxidoreductase [Corynebacterium endometrii]